PEKFYFRILRAGLLDEDSALVLQNHISSQIPNVPQSIGAWIRPQISEFYSAIETQSAC
ncbi:hypothetical protein IscW_ISCW022838, partial [Ixodes scapularis]